MRYLTLLVAYSLFAADVIAGEWGGDIEGEYRYFYREAIDADQHRDYFSVALAPEWYSERDDGRQALTIKPFYRWDQYDATRTHGDIRELFWSYFGNDYEVDVGVRKVFWGTAESQHLVNIINQTDLVENPDGEVKLGQPMISAKLIRSWGDVEFFLMRYFRERTFPGEEGRLRTIPRIDTEQDAVYESAHEDKHIDWAVRLLRRIDNWDIGLSYFHGTAREPLLLPGTDETGSIVNIPFYPLMRQSAIDVQGAVGAWLWKLEAVYRNSRQDDYYAYVGGFEYTFYRMLETDIDLGMVLEYSQDERGIAATSAFDHDLMLGLRLTPNDVQSTEFLLALIWDKESHARLLRLEASRRLTPHIKLNIEGAEFAGLSAIDPLYSYRQDDYFQLGVSYYF